MFSILADEVSSSTSIWYTLIVSGSTLLGVTLTLIFQSVSFRKNSITTVELDIKKNHRASIEKAYAEVIAGAKDFHHIVFQFFETVRTLDGKTSQGITVNGFKYSSVDSFFATYVANPYNKYLHIYKDNFLYLENVASQVESVTDHMHRLHNLAVFVARNGFKVTKKDEDSLDKETDAFKLSFQGLLDAARSDLSSFKIQ